MERFVRLLACALFAIVVLPLASAHSGESPSDGCQITPYPYSPPRYGVFVEHAGPGCSPSMVAAAFVEADDTHPTSFGAGAGVGACARTCEQVYVIAIAYQNTGSNQACTDFEVVFVGDARCTEV